MKIAIIPARGGSQRIPRKNIKPFLGKPMIAWSIEAAFHSGCFEHIWVSTDDPEIADVALSYGAEVPFMRPQDLSDHHTATTPVVAHAIEWAKAHGPRRHRQSNRRAIMSTWEFDTTTGAGSEIVTVVYEYENDGETTYNESIKEIWFNGRDVMGLLSDEQFKELDMEAAMRFQHHKLNYKMEDV